VSGGTGELPFLQMKIFLPHTKLTHPSLSSGIKNVCFIQGVVSFLLE